MIERFTTKRGIQKFTVEKLSSKKYFKPTMSFSKRWPSPWWTGDNILIFDWRMCGKVTLNNVSLCYIHVIKFYWRISGYLCYNVRIPRIYWQYMSHFRVVSSTGIHPHGRESNSQTFVMILNGFTWYRYKPKSNDHGQFIVSYSEVH
jgi:hypothetical protein